MLRVPVTSSNLKAVGYDPLVRTLEIEFNNGGVYQYHDVPSDIHVGLMSAQSKGTYFNSHIKDRFRFTKIQ